MDLERAGVAAGGCRRRGRCDAGRRRRNGRRDGVGGVGRRRAGRRIRPGRRPAGRRAAGEGHDEDHDDDEARRRRAHDGLLRVTVNTYYVSTSFAPNPRLDQCRMAHSPRRHPGPAPSALGASRPLAGGDPVRPGRRRSGSRGRARSGCSAGRRGRRRACRAGAGCRPGCSRPRRRTRGPRPWRGASRAGGRGPRCGRGGRAACTRSGSAPGAHRAGAPLPRAKSTSRSPERKDGARLAGAGMSRRRRTALTRAMSSRWLNGFVT